MSLINKLIYKKYNNCSINTVLRIFFTLIFFSLCTAHAGKHQKLKKSNYQHIFSTRAYLGARIHNKSGATILDLSKSIPAIPHTRKEQAQLNKIENILAAYRIETITKRIHTLLQENIFSPLSTIPKPPQASPIRTKQQKIEIIPKFDIV